MKSASPEVVRDALAARGRARRGFTLLEVLAAVVILAIWYTVIANAAIRGLGREGESLRLLEAALLADNVLAEIEASMVDGTAPEEMQDSREQDPYMVEMQVGPFGGRLAAFAKKPAEDDPDAPPPSLQTLVGREMPGVSGYLRTISVKVTWEEAGYPREISRTTYAFDTSKAIEELYPEGEEEAAGAIEPRAPSTLDDQDAGGEDEENEDGGNR